MKPEDQAAAWHKKRQRLYMKAYREKNRERLRVQRRTHYQKTKKGEGKTDGETQR